MICQGVEHHLQAGEKLVRWGPGLPHGVGYDRAEAAAVETSAEDAGRLGIAWCNAVII